MAVSRVQLLKFLELALVIVCLGLHYHSYGTWHKFHEVIIPGAAFGGYLIILVVLAAGSFSGQPINKRVDILFSLVGCAVFVAAGAFAIEEFQHYNKGEQRNIGLSKGAMAIINGAIFLIDAGLSFRGE